MLVRFLITIMIKIPTLQVVMMVDQLKNAKSTYRKGISNFDSIDNIRINNLTLNYIKSEFNNCIVTTDDVLFVSQIEIDNSEINHLV